MRVVGVDQSYTGFGFSIDGEAKKKSFPTSRYDSDTHRLIAIQGWFTQWLTLQAKAGLDLVVREGYANGAKFGREIAGELGGVVNIAALEVTGTPPVIVPPTSLKKFVLGKGVGKKNEMLLGVYKQWNVSFSDDNQADAYALEKFGYAYRDVTRGRTGAGWHKYQIEAVEAVLKGK